MESSFEVGPEYRYEVVHSDWTLLKTQGGMGLLLRARDPLRGGRHVVIKTIKPESSEKDREQLRYEADLSIRLEHPGIAPVYGIGATAGGDPFFTMRYLSDYRLEDAVRAFHENRATLSRAEESLQFRDLLTRFVAVCRTIEYVHKQGVVHLDIKPQNIMLGKYGETFLIDWGLARKFDDLALTCLLPQNPESVEQRTKAGTIPFMSPEQVRGDACLGATCDIYSLGATLFYLLTNKWAVGDPGIYPDFALKKIRQGMIRAPREVDPKLSKTLNAICTKAMALKPGDRYPSASALAEDIERYFADLPTSARRETVPERLSRLTRRHSAGVRTAVMALGVLLVVSCGFAYAMSNLARETERASERTQAALEVAVERQRQLLQSVAESKAQGLAADFSACWRVLELGAENSELQQAMASLQKGHGNPELVQRWLAEFNDSHLEMDIRVTSYLITDANGFLVAGTGAAKRLVGEDCSNRSYFHGKAEPEPNATEKVTPTVAPYVSQAFASKAEGAPLRICFSVPIWDKQNGADNRSVVGVLVMAVPVGTFRRQPDVESRIQLVVADVRSSELVDGDSPARGLVLNHPEFDDEIHVQDAVYLPGPTLLEIQPMDLLVCKPMLLETYVDPKEGRPKNAAACPIVIKYDNGEIQTNLLAIAQVASEEL